MDLLTVCVRNVHSEQPLAEPACLRVCGQDMEGEVCRALRGGSQDEMLSEGFRLTITRKDLQTLSHLNWLNDEVRARHTLLLFISPSHTTVFGGG